MILITVALDDGRLISTSAVDTANFNPTEHLEPLFTDLVNSINMAIELEKSPKSKLVVPKH